MVPLWSEGRFFAPLGHKWKQFSWNWTTLALLCFLFLLTLCYISTHPVFPARELLLSVAASPICHLCLPLPIPSFAILHYAFPDFTVSNFYTLPIFLLHPQLLHPSLLQSQWPPFNFLLSHCWTECTDVRTLSNLFEIWAQLCIIVGGDDGRKGAGGCLSKM